MNRIAKILVCLAGTVIIYWNIRPAHAASLENSSTIVHKGPYLLYNGNNTEMQVLWQLDAAATSIIQWGEDTSYSLGREQTTEYGDDHQHTFTITNLSPAKKYFYRVIAGADSLVGSFRTAPPFDATDLKFIAYGDTRSHPSIHDQLAEAIINTYQED